MEGNDYQKIFDILEKAGYGCLFNITEILELPPQEKVNLFKRHLLVNDFRKAFEELYGQYKSSSLDIIGSLLFTRPVVEIAKQITVTNEQHKEIIHNLFNNLKSIFTDGMFSDLSYYIVYEQIVDAVNEASREVERTGNNVLLSYQRQINMVKLLICHLPTCLDHFLMPYESHKRFS